MGEIIARFHAGYVKETPKDYVPDSRDNAPGWPERVVSTPRLTM